jgi:hypothetical protein
MTDRELMQQVLEALESDPISHAGLVSRKQAITALRQALETEREWVGLTDQEINSVRHSRDWTAHWTDTTFARAIEAKLREKNT